MRTGRPKARLILSPDEKRTLRSWSLLDGDTPPLVGRRARMILMAATGATNTEIAATLDVSAQTVCKWRRRFVERRVEGLR